MLDIKFIRENVDLVKENCVNRKVKVDIDKLLALDESRRENLSKIETLRAERNKKSKGKPTDEEIAKMRTLGESIAKLEAEEKITEEQYSEFLLKVPNMADESTPIGPDESGNKVLRVAGNIPKFDFTPKEHWELGKQLGLIDNEKAGEISGSRFTYIKGNLALLQFALINFALSIVTNEKEIKKIIKKYNLDISSGAFVPVIPPVMIKPDVYQKMARLEPKDERYYISSDDVYLIGSAEHTLGPLHMDEIIDEKDLPIRYVGYSPAFRREAGSYGKDMKGILRLHQFDKVELESFCLPEKSIEEQDLFVAIQEEIVSRLGLPYRVMQICTGDMGGPDARQIDIETWMPGQNRYRETHTADMMTDYQARRLKTRVKKSDGSIEFVHMNDATAIAIGRMLIAIMENYQQKDGSIAVPKALKKYCGLKKL
ncbi:MAG: serine--tRNA ligase [Patescibacteria group bacterium]|nr:serine--tRNA ligase [Patescibacteria group bacterium]